MFIKELHSLKTVTGEVELVNFDLQMTDFEKVFSYCTRSKSLKFAIKPDSIGSVYKF